MASSSGPVASASPRKKAAWKTAWATLKRTSSTVWNCRTLPPSIRRRAIGWTRWRMFGFTARLTKRPRNSLPRKSFGPCIRCLTKRPLWKRSALTASSVSKSTATAIRFSYFREHYQTLAKEAAEKNWTPLDYLSRLVEGEALRRKDRATQRRLQAARFPVVKTLEQFDWSWPKKINRPHVQNLFRLSFLQEKANVIFMGGAGLGKSHLATALAYEACLAGHTVLFTTA